MVKLLLSDPSCDRHDVGESYRTALHVAAWNNRGPMVRSLLRAGLHHDATDVAEESPVMLACRRGLIEPVRILLLKVCNMCVCERSELSTCTNTHVRNKEFYFIF